MNEILTFIGSMGLLFWGIFALWFIIAVVSVENERFTFTTPVVIVGVAGLIWLSHVNVWDWLSHNIVTVLIALAVYLVMGVLYGMARYSFYVQRVSDDFKEWIARKKYNPEAITESQARDFKMDYHIKNFPLQVADSKHRIIFWGIYWPFSMPWTVINEPVKRFFHFMYARVAGMLQRMTDRKFKNVNIVADPPKPDPKMPRGLGGIVDQSHNPWSSTRGGNQEA